MSIYGIDWQTLSMLYFVTVLSCVCISDFKRRLIPHAITYPSIIVGILYSTLYRHDGIGALAGVGISYIVFDFSAFYGQILYTKFAVPISDREEETKSNGNSDEQEVIGGGDAVLAALIASFLGWERLIYALIVSTIVGGIMAAVYRLRDLQRSQKIEQCCKPSVIGFAVAFAAVLLCYAIFVGLFSAGKMLELLPAWLMLAGAVGVIGSLAGIVLGTSSESKSSKSIPLAFALSCGGVIAMFHNPLGLILHGGN
ncbi:hypothetical protein BH10CYA1_BH10CYA1_28110 [soil metagenome]